MKNVLLLAILFFPVLAWAEYNPEAIKKGLTEQKDAFQITSWRQSENGEASIANTGLKGVVLSVGKKNSGILASLQNSEQAAPAMVRCLMLGAIGMTPKNEAQRGKIGEVIKSATKTQSANTLVMNGVEFEVSPQEVEGNVFLSCMLRPAKK